MAYDYYDAVTVMEKKRSLEPNQERHRVRAELVEKRRECYKLSYHVKMMRFRGKEPSLGKIEKLRGLRRECKELSKRMCKVAPYIRIKNGEEVWLMKSFRRFRHSSRSTRWLKVAGGWKPRYEGQ